MHGSVKSQVGAIWSRIDGIGSSKASARAGSARTDLLGARPVSEYVHSLQYKEEIIRTAVDIGSFAREEFNVKDMGKINGEVVQSWIESKIETGVSKATLANYIAHLSKIQIGLEKISEEKGRECLAFSRADLVSARTLLAEMPAAAHENRAYQCPGTVISWVSSKEHIVGQLQLYYGLRVAEAARIEARQLKGNELNVQGKGGYYLSKTLSDELAAAIRSHMDGRGVFEVDQNRYRESLRESCRIVGEKYSGSHGLRYNYAQETYRNSFDAHLAKGMTHKEADRAALAATSEAMGHHREEITHHYLS